MEDFEIAHDILERENLSFVVVKNGNPIFRGKSNGIMDFLIAIRDLGDELNDSSVADRIVGKASAMLIIRSKIKKVYAKLMSEYAIKTLKQSNIPFVCERKTEVILNKAQTSICPFENMAINSNNPEEAYIKFKDFLHMS
ncbi:MAG: DUF1893 domain-containing protein [Candidatus Aenigmatarchaeota archaeon]